MIDARLRFVRDVQRGVFAVAELCRRHQISRPVAYKWLARFEQGGPPALADHSRRPRSCPHATEPALVTALCELRRRRPHWGAKKLLVKLQRQLEFTRFRGRLAIWVSSRMGVKPFEGDG